MPAARKRVDIRSDSRAPVGPLAAGATDEGDLPIRICRATIGISDESVVSALPFASRRGRSCISRATRERASRLLRRPTAASSRYHWSCGDAVSGTVWHELLRIPFGETRSYADIAPRRWRSKASRAVGNANGQKPTSPS